MRKALLGCCFVVCVGLGCYAATVWWRHYAGDKQAKLGTAEEQRDMVCGPRCVQFLLNHYGTNEDLIDLIREIQWPELEAGASLESIDTALRKRGVHTLAIKIDPEAGLQWPYPVLLHLKGKRGIGHYVVWLPENKHGATSGWIGFVGVRMGWTKKLAREVSGAVLLTSPVPITSPPESAVREPTIFDRLFSWRGGAGVAIVVAGGWFFAVGVRRLRRVGRTCFFLAFSERKV